MNKLWQHYQNTANNWKPNWTSIWPSIQCNNLSNKHFTEDAYKLLNKNLNFVPAIKKFNKKLLEINDFYRRIKLEAHFRDNTKVREQTVGEIFKKPINKMWAPNKNHLTIETFIDGTKNGVKDELKTVTRLKFLNMLISISNQ